MFTLFEEKPKKKICKFRRSNPYFDTYPLAGPVTYFLLTLSIPNG